jgi:hypothetical protein
MVGEAMTESSLTPAEMARKAHGRILRKLQAPGSGVALAEALRASEATVSRIKNERLGECLELIYAAGFKVVARDRYTIHDDSLAFFKRIAVGVLSDDALTDRFLRDNE